MWLLWSLGRSRWSTPTRLSNRCPKFKGRVPLKTRISIVQVVTLTWIEMLLAAFESKKFLRISVKYLWLESETVACSRREPFVELQPLVEYTHYVLRTVDWTFLSRFNGIPETGKNCLVVRPGWLSTLQMRLPLTKHSKKLYALELQLQPDILLYTSAFGCCK